MNRSPTPQQQDKTRDEIEERLDILEQQRRQTHFLLGKALHHPLFGQHSQRLIQKSAAQLKALGKMEKEELRRKERELYRLQQERKEQEEELQNSRRLRQRFVFSAGAALLLLVASLILFSAGFPIREFLGSSAVTGAAGIPSLSSLELQGSSHFRASDPVVFTLASTERKGNLLTGYYVVSPLKKQVTATLTDPSGREIVLDEEVKETKQGLQIALDTTQRAFKAGAYHLRVNAFFGDAGSAGGGETTFEQDFTWGVLAINVNKSMYLEHEDAFIGIAVLDDAGHTVCNASVTLEIMNPLHEKTTLTTANGDIQISPECALLGITQLPDYYTTYSVNGVGTYVMNLTADTLNGVRSIQDTFSVVHQVDFEVARKGPTRIFPPVNYAMNLTIKANRDHAGMIKEYVPASFDIAPQEGLTVTTVGDAQELVWKEQVTAGETRTIGYTFDAPDLSPEFYVLGPLEIGTFTEARQWQIASDAFVAITAGWAGSGMDTTEDDVTLTVQTTCLTDSITNVQCVHIDAVGGNDNDLNLKVNRTVAPSTLSALTLRLFADTNSGTVIVYAYSDFNTVNTLDSVTATLTAGQNNDINVNRLINDMGGGGAYSLRVIASGNAHVHISEASVEETTVDATAPLVTITNPANGTNFSSGTQAFNATVNDASLTDMRVLFQFNQTTTGTASVLFNESATNISGNWNLNLDLTRLAEGLQNMTVFANDSANNMNRTEFIQFTLDRTPPNVSNFFMNVSNASNFTNGVIMVNATLNDSLLSVDEVRFQFLNPSNNSPFNVTATKQGSFWYTNLSLAAMSEAIYQIQLLANDTVNNLNNSNRNLTFTLDRTPPNISNFFMNVSNASNFTNGDIMVNATLNDSLLTVETVRFGFSNPRNASQFNITATKQGSFWYANFSLVPLSEAVYTIRLYGNDTLGNTNNSVANLTFTLDRTPPNVSSFAMNASNASNFSGGIITFNATANDTVATVETVRFGFYNPSNASQFNVTATLQGGYYYTDLSLSLLSDAIYQARVYANDTLNNVNNSVQNLTFTLDKTPPNVSNFFMNVSNASIFKSTSTIVINATINDSLMMVETVRFGITSANNNSQFNITATLQGSYWYTNVTFAALRDARYTVRAYANDTLGLVNNTNANLTFIVDTIPPNVTNTTPARNSALNTGNAIEVSINVTEVNFLSNITANVTRPGGTVDILALGNSTGNPTKFNTSYTIPSTEGVYNVSFFANDTVHNFNSTETSNFTATVLDTSPPNVTLLNPALNSLFNTTLSFEIAANVTDTGIVSTVLANITYANGTRTYFTLSNSTGNPTKFNISFRVPEASSGVHNITFTANDTVNNFNTSTSTNFTARVGCGTVTIDTSMDQDVLASGLCFTVSGNSAVFNCSGYQINYSYGGVAGSGVNVTGNNVTVKNCVVREGTSVAASKDAIYVEGFNVTVENNTIFMIGQSSGGVHVAGTLARENKVRNNRIFTDGDDAGIVLARGTFSNVIENNNITVSIGGSWGILITTLGSGLNPDRNLFVNNNITARQFFEILDETGSNSLNQLVYNNTFGEIKWQDNGSANGFLDNLTLNITNDQGIGLNKNLYIENNTVALNTSAVSSDTRRINSSANVTLIIPLSSVDAIMRYNDYSTSASTIRQSGTNCTAGCQRLSYSAGRLLFNVTSFSSYSADQLPSAPVTLAPANGSAITNRTPIFDWLNSSDGNGEVISYHLQVDDNALFNNPEINVSAILDQSAVAPGNTTWLSTVTLNLDIRYYWRVRANDSVGFGDWSNAIPGGPGGAGEGLNQSNFTVDSLLSITLPTSAIEFGNMVQNQRENTTDGSPAPMRGENNGNIFFNVSINASRYFSIVAMNTTYYQYQFRENESGSFNRTESSINWTNMSLDRISRVDISELDWRDANDDFLLDLNITVPNDEPSGFKSSIITLTITSSNLG